MLIGGKNISVTCVWFRKAARTTDNRALRYRMIIKKYGWQNVGKETTELLWFEFDDSSTILIQQSIRKDKIWNSYYNKTLYHSHCAITTVCHYNCVPLQLCTITTVCHYNCVPLKQCAITIVCHYNSVRPSFKEKFRSFHKFLYHTFDMRHNLQFHLLSCNITSSLVHFMFFRTQ